MSEIEKQITVALQVLFSEKTIAKQDRPNLSVIKDEVCRFGNEQRQAFIEQLLATTWPKDNIMALYFYLFDLFEDARFITKACEFLPNHLSPQLFYEFNFNVAQRMFTNKGDKQLIAQTVRDSYEALSSDIRAFLNSQGYLNRKKVTSIQNIAIISPQLMDMRHSPTREAFSIACHLQTYLGCNVTIINTNAGAGVDNSELRLISPAVYGSNQNLKDTQELRIQYLDFDQNIRIVSFPPEPMSTKRITHIAHTLKQLDIDAVICHGDNLLAQDTAYGVYPSIFATTGTVVPNCHCDSYFVPGNLFNESSKALADKYGHSDFMLESMLVTPQGKAEHPTSKRDFFIDDKVFVYLVVGVRLEKEVDQEFATACAEILSAQENATILFAGSPKLDLDALFDKQLIADRQVVNIGFHQDLPAVSLMADVYLNPKRSGGGTSSQTAILNGLPIVTLNIGHISAVVPDSHRLDDWQAYVEYAIALRKEAGLLQQEAQIFKTHYVENLDSKNQILKMHSKLCQIASEKYQ